MKKQMNTEMKSTLLGMVLEVCKSYGMTAKDVQEIFNKRTIEGGMKILEQVKV